MSNADQSQFNLTNAAARSREERALLAPIVENPTDLSARAEYHRWLEKAGDRRVNFSRAMLEYVEEFLSSTEHSRYIPFSVSGYAAAWTNMLGYPLFRIIANREELWSLRDIILRYAKPRLAITPEAIGIGDPPMRASRFGGIASLPADMPWPTYSEGPLGFLGQISLREIQHTQAARHLPDTGWLAFFADIWGVYGTAGDTQVMYVAEDCDLAWREPPKNIREDFGESFPSTPCRLVFTETWDLPDESDLVVSETDQQRMKNATPRVYLNDVLPNQPEFDCHLFGYSRHARTSDPSPSVEWQNLLCVGSIDSLGWNWCDGEHLAVFIQGEHLRARDFSQVSGYAS